jgi:hypothetical protein
MPRKTRVSEETGNTEPKRQALSEGSDTKTGSPRQPARTSPRKGTIGAKKSGATPAKGEASRQTPAETLGEAAKSMPAEKKWPGPEATHVESPAIDGKWSTGRSKAGGLSPQSASFQPGIGAEKITPAVPTGVTAKAPQAEKQAFVQTPSLHEQIARLAYSYWEARGYQPGNPQEDWYRAEREILSRRKS